VFAAGQRAGTAQRICRAGERQSVRAMGAPVGVLRGEHAELELTEGHD
jgi:hypothetical protein